MSTGEGATDSAPSLPPARAPRKRAKRPASPSPSEDFSQPAEKPPNAVARLESTYCSWLEDLRAEKKALTEDVGRLRSRLAEMAPENARLKEALRAIQWVDLVSAAFITGGGSAMSYAAFIEDADREFATGGLVATLAGLALLVAATFRRWASE